MIRTVCYAAAAAMALAACAGAEPTAQDGALYSLERPSFQRYIAFGDSFVSGVGAPDVEWTPCGTSHSAWPYRVQADMQIPELVFAACSGATTLDVVGTGGLGMPSQMSQLPAADALDSALITITIGGNDIKLDERLRKCLKGSSSISSLEAGCDDLEQLLDNAADVTNDALAPNLISAFKALRVAAPKATIAAVGYPHLVDASDPACDATLTGALINRDNRQRMNDLADAINAQIASAAADAGILSITDEVVAHFKGHEACSQNEWIVSPDTTLRTGNFGVTHPNDVGYQVYADAVEAGLTRLLNK